VKKAPSMLSFPQQPTTAADLGAIGEPIVEIR
jgi:hypothetical protein